VPVIPTSVVMVAARRALPEPGRGANSWLSTCVPSTVGHGVPNRADAIRVPSRSALNIISVKRVHRYCVSVATITTFAGVRPLIFACENNQRLRVDISVHNAERELAEVILVDVGRGKLVLSQVGSRSVRYRNARLEHQTWAARRQRPAAKPSSQIVLNIRGSW